MKICLYRAFPDPYRQSMTLYADQLAENIRPLLTGQDSLQDFLPASIRMNPALLRYFSQYITYQRAVSRIQADVHHIIDHSYAHLLHSLPAQQTVITFHDAIWMEKPAGFGRQWIRNRNLSALRKAGALIFDSRSSRNALLKRLNYPDDRIFLIYPGLDPLFFEKTSGDPFAALGIKPGLYILHVGHTGAYKNIPALFHVLAALRKKGLDVKLLKTGTPFTAAQNQLADDLNMTSHTVHLGLVNRTQMPLIYRAAQCLLFPSLNEGFGFPVLEAMASGTPVISSHRGSLPELATRPEMLFAPNDYYGMSRRIAEIIEDKQLRENLIEEGRTHVRKFQWQETAKKILTVYQKINSGRT